MSITSGLRNGLIAFGEADKVCTYGRMFWNNAALGGDIGIEGSGEEWVNGEVWMQGAVR